MVAKDEARPSAGQIRVLLVDDHPVVRQGIRMLVNGEDDMVLCGEAADAAQALAAIKESKPDVAIVDLMLEEGSGLDLIKDIRVRHPEVRVLVLSMRDEAFYAERVLQAGAMGYVAKQEGAGRIIHGIREVYAGRICLSDQMTAKVLRKLAGGAETASSPVSQLTDRELQIFEMIGKGVPTRQISESLHISPKTVDSHREHIKQKLKLDSAPELLKYAVQWVQGQHGA